MWCMQRPRLLLRSMSRVQGCHLGRLDRRNSSRLPPRSTKDRHPSSAPRPDASPNVKHQQSESPARPRPHRYGCVCAAFAEASTQRTPHSPRGMGMTACCMQCTQLCGGQNRASARAIGSPLRIGTPHLPLQRHQYIACCTHVVHVHVQFQAAQPPMKSTPPQQLAPRGCHFA